MCVCVCPCVCVVMFRRISRVKSASKYCIIFYEATYDHIECSAVVITIVSTLLKPRNIISFTGRTYKLNKKGNGVV